MKPLLLDVKSLLRDSIHVKEIHAAQLDEEFHFHNAYIKHETTIPGYNFGYMIGAKFTKGKNEIFPIPQAQIDLSVVDGKPALLQQNPGY